MEPEPARFALRLTCGKCGEAGFRLALVGIPGGDVVVGSQSGSLVDETQRPVLSFTMCSHFAHKCRALWPSPMVLHDITRRPLRFGMASKNPYMSPLKRP
jgi:hypothetical protein